MQMSSDREAKKRGAATVGGDAVAKEITLMSVPDGEKRTTEATGRERRATVRALSDWSRHSGDSLPSFTEMRDTFDDADAWRDRFLLKRDAIPARSVFIMCGDAVRAWTAIPPVSRTLDEVVPAGVRETVCALCEAAARTSEPQSADDSYHEPSGAEIMYRCIFLPMRGAESELDYIMGAFSAKRTMDMPAP